MSGICRSGLTLIEVLVSIVLLTMIAGVCTSLLRDAAVISKGGAAGPMSVERLGLLADAVIADPQMFGIESLSEVTDQELQMPEGFSDFVDEAVSTIRLQRLESSYPEADHVWVVLIAGAGDEAACVTRWGLKPREKESETEDQS